MELVRPHLITLDVTPAQATAAAQHGNFIVAIKDALIVAGIGAWSLIASAIPGTANTNDNWATGANITRAAPGTAHSWALLENSEGVQLLIDCSVVDTQIVRLVWARPDDQFSTAGLSDLNAPTPPASALEYATWQFLNNTPTLFNHRLHVWRDSLGSFVVGVGQAGSGILASAMYMFRLTTSQGAALGVEAIQADVEDYPYITGQFYNATGLGAFGGLTFTNNNSLYTNMWSSAGVPIVGVIDRRNVLSTMSAAGTVIGSYPSARMEIFTDSTEVAFRGIIPDWRMIPGTPAYNDRDGLAQAFSQISIGNVDGVTNGNDPITL